jgi:hypothetical protein
MTVMLAFDERTLLDQCADRPAFDGSVGRSGGLQGQLALRAGGHGAVSTQTEC